MTSNQVWLELIRPWLYVNGGMISKMKPVLPVRIKEIHANMILYYVYVGDVLSCQDQTTRLLLVRATTVNTSAFCLKKQKSSHNWQWGQGFEPCLEHLIAHAWAMDRVRQQQFGGVRGGFGLMVRKIVRKTVNIDSYLRIIGSFGTWCNWPLKSS